MQNKKGIIGGFISMFVATLIIVVFLALFVLSATIIKEYIKETDNSQGGVVLADEQIIGINNIYSYKENYTSLTIKRVLTLEEQKIIPKNTFKEYK